MLLALVTEAPTSFYNVVYKEMNILWKVLAVYWKKFLGRTIHNIWSISIVDTTCYVSTPSSKSTSITK